VYSGIGLAADRHVCAQCGKSDNRVEICAFGDKTVWLHPECQRPWAAKFPLPAAEDPDLAEAAVVQTAGAGPVIAAARR
jgi:hypothetical protein